MCARCKELQREVDRLENLLAESVYIDGLKARALEAPLRLSGDQAQILYLLHMARGRPLTAPEINTAMPDVPRQPGGMRRLDPDFRSPQCIRTQISHIRRKLGYGFVESSPVGSGGYWLPEASRAAVAAVLAA